MKKKISLREAFLTSSSLFFLLEREEQKKMSPSLAAAAASVLRRRGSHPLTSLLSSAARDGGATASASGRGAWMMALVPATWTSLPLSNFSLFSSFSSLAGLSHGSGTTMEMLRGARILQTSSFSTSVSVSTSPRSPSSQSSTPPETSASFVRLNNIFPSPGSKSQVSRWSMKRGIIMKNCSVKRIEFT